MISRVCLQNFQSHEESELELSPGINVIVGSSNSGKSAIVRAMEGVRTNRPWGTSFVRRGTRGATVALYVLTTTRKHEHSGSGRTQLTGIRGMMRNTLPREAKCLRRAGPSSNWTT